MGEKTLLTTQELLEATHGYVFKKDALTESFLNTGVSSVVVDSRNVQKNALFIPLIGENQDGHMYVESAVKSGATIVLVQESSVNEFSSVYTIAVEQNIVIIVVKNTLTALQDSANFYVKKFPFLKKIAVTGSNGKTTVKECIGSVLAQKYNVIMNVGNLNSETGLPLSMFAIRSEHEIGVFEMGMNRRGEIKELADVFFPDLAIITNIGTAHIGILGTQRAIAEEKKQIFSNFNVESIGYIFEDESYMEFLKKNVLGTITTYGAKTTLGVEKIISKGLDGSEIKYNNTSINFPLVGEHNVQNACVAISIAQYFDVSTQEIKKGLEAVMPLFGRSQIVHGNYTFIQDCYNGSYESMSASIDFFENVEWNGQKIAILGDMLELGEKSSEIHQVIVKRILASDVNARFFIGEHFSKALSDLCVLDRKTVYSTAKIDDDSVTSLIKSYCPIFDSSDLILVKGSRGIKLERVIDLLQHNSDKKEAK